MADPYGEPGGFPDSHTTATTTTTTQAATTSSSVGCTFDKGYLLSIQGILYAIMILVGFLYWVVVASTSYFFGGYGWVVFVAVSAWVFTVILYILHVFMLTKKVTIIHWPLTELINNATWSLLHFIGAIVISVAAGRAAPYGALLEHGKLVFCSLCGWALFVLYFVCTFFNYREFMAVGGISSVRGLGGGTQTTTTTTTTTVITSQSGGPPGEKTEQPPPYPGGPFT